MLTVDADELLEAWQAASGGDRDLARILSELGVEVAKEVEIVRNAKREKKERQAMSEL